jgi:hypothetical protein
MQQFDDKHHMSRFRRGTSLHNSPRVHNSSSMRPPRVRMQCRSTEACSLAATCFQTRRSKHVAFEVRRLTENMRLQHRCIGTTIQLPFAAYGRYIVFGSSHDTRARRVIPALVSPGERLDSRRLGEPLPLLFFGLWGTWECERSNHCSPAVFEGRRPSCIDCLHSFILCPTNIPSRLRPL